MRAGGTGQEAAGVRVTESPGGAGAGWADGKADLGGRSGSQAPQGSREHGPLGYGKLLLRAKAEGCHRAESCERVTDMQRAGPALLAEQVGGRLAQSPKAAALFGSVRL